MFFTTDPKFRPVRSLPLYQTLLCVVCVLILVLNGVSLVRNLDGLKTANARQAQADRVTAKLQYLNLLVTDAESGLRGYYLSGSAALTIVGLLAIPETRDEDLARQV